MPTRVLLADDHVILRQGLKALLEPAGFSVVGEASDGREAIRLAHKLNPEVAVLDLSLPLLNGLDAAREIHQTCPRTRALILTMHAEDHYLLEALRAGVRGYLVKTHAAADLIQAIQDVQRGLVYLDPSLSRAVVEAYLGKTAQPADPLSSRERQVLQLLAEGKTTKESARLMSLSIKTVESHRTHIMQKLNIHGVAGLVRYALRQGLTQL
jgi:two-component system, NarL family, response regulator NreC